MIKRRFKLIILAVFFLVPLYCFLSRTYAEEFSSFIETFPNGKIDWDSGYFYGTGKGYLHLNNGSKARALKVAQAGALSAILQVASRLKVDESNTISDLRKKKIIIQIEGLIHYEPYERKFFKKKYPFYMTTYRAPMNGVKGLTKKLLSKFGTQFESDRHQPGQEIDDNTDDISPWLILDARRIGQNGNPVEPALFPKIMTKRGEIVYDLNSVEEGAVVERGMARYVASDLNRDELGFLTSNNPLDGLRDLFSPRSALAEESRKRKRRGRYIIKDVKQASGLMKTNLVISEKDARDINKENASSRILKKCRVIVIVSSSLGGIEGRSIMHLAFYL